MNGVKVRFLHPLEGKSISVSIPEGVKVKEGVNQLIRSGFLPASKDGYMLSCGQGESLDMEAVFTESSLCDGDSIVIELKTGGNSASDDFGRSSVVEETKEQEATFVTPTRTSTHSEESIQAIWEAVRKLEEKQHQTNHLIKEIRNQHAQSKTAESYEDIYSVINDLKKMGGVKIPSEAVLNTTAWFQLLLIGLLGLTYYLFTFSAPVMQWLFQFVV